MMMTEHNGARLPAFFGDRPAPVASLAQLCSQDVSLTEYRFAHAIQRQIVIYDSEALFKAMQSKSKEQEVLAELNTCLYSGPGVFAIKGAYPDKQLIDQVTALFKSIIADEKQGGQTQGDHFGANERIWNSLQKVAERDAELFVAYYGNPLLALACRAWLGPFYQITAQVNNVKPGSVAQTPHRDYHLGFQSAEVIAQFPVQAQVMSQFLTLQGAIAHTDMPLESGPTLLLPFSQQLPSGYLSFSEPEFVAYFNDNFVQLPLEKGDAVFFSPALFHGAGNNQSEHDRMANLVQVSSTFGRPMETVNRMKMIEAVYPVLFAQRDQATGRSMEDAITALADGYSFPTNLDADPPLGGNAPKTARDYLKQGLVEGWPVTRLMEELERYHQRRLA